MVTRHFLPAEIPFDFQRAYSFLKIRPASDKFPMMQAMVARLREQFQSIFAPRYRYAIYPVAGTQPAAFSVLLEGGASLTGAGVHRVLSQSRHAAIFIATVGEAIDAAVAKLASEDFAEAFFLDGVASAMTHGLLQLLKNDLRAEANQRHCHLAQRCSPGYAHWALPEQKKLFHLLKSEEIGVTLSATYFMTPQKSLSGVFGFKSITET